MYCYIEEATEINEEQTAIYYRGLVNVNLIRNFHQQFFLRKNFNGNNSLFIRNLPIRGYTRTLINQLNQRLYTPRTLSKQQLSPRNRRFCTRSLHQRFWCTKQFYIRNNSNFYTKRHSSYIQFLNNTADTIYFTCLSHFYSEPFTAETCSTKRRLRRKPFQIYFFYTKHLFTTATTTTKTRTTTTTTKTTTPTSHTLTLLH